MKNKIIISLIGLLVLGGGAWYATRDESNTATLNPALTAHAATVYFQPNCGCCKEYMKYLEQNGIDIERKEISLEELGEKKEELGIPAGAAACHTMVIDDYVVEGHVPVETIEQLLTEKPEIDGIALPGMPMGSPGMTGFKTGVFKIQSFADGSTTGIYAEQ